MTQLALGLMSGTSLDGVDAALVEIHDRHTVELASFLVDPFSAQLRDSILHVTAGGTVRDIALLHVSLGEAFAQVALSLLAQASVAPTKLSFVASHGQTVWHEPGKASLQLGDPAVIAERLGVRVVSDFRGRDVAAGGQGAPLVPIADAMLFADPRHGRVLLNLGGMANFTWVPRRGSLEGVVACDTGPGVAVIDTVTRAVDPTARFDVDGARASRGTPADDVVTELLAHPFFAAAPPKSTGRELFGEHYAHSLVARVRERHPGATSDDCVATGVALTVRSVQQHLKRWVPATEGTDLVVSGGGARNPVLVQGLRSALALPVRRFDDEFFDGDAKEAVAFAYLGWLTLHERSGNVPSATGAKGPRVLGRVTPA